MDSVLDSWIQFWIHGFNFGFMDSLLDSLLDSWIHSRIHFRIQGFTLGFTLGLDSLSSKVSWTIGSGRERYSRFTDSLSEVKTMFFKSIECFEVFVFNQFVLQKISRWHAILQTASPPSLPPVGGTGDPPEIAQRLSRTRSRPRRSLEPGK